MSLSQVAGRSVGSPHSVLPTISLIKSRSFGFLIRSMFRWQKSAISCHVGRPFSSMKSTEPKRFRRHECRRRSPRRRFFYVGLDRHAVCWACAVDTSLDLVGNSMEIGAEGLHYLRGTTRRADNFGISGGGQHPNSAVEFFGEKLAFRARGVGAHAPRS
jgi:hypothetical protein